MLSTIIEYTPVATNPQGGGKFPFPLGLAPGNVGDYYDARVSRAGESQSGHAFFLGIRGLDQKEMAQSCLRATSAVGDDLAPTPALLPLEVSSMAHLGSQCQAQTHKRPGGEPGHLLSTARHGQSRKGCAMTLPQPPDAHNASLTLDLPPGAPCPFPWCPNKRRLHRALVLLRDLAVLIHVTDDTPTTTVPTPQGAPHE
jgi:hypothetical protein